MIHVLSRSLHTNDVLSHFSLISLSRQFDEYRIYVRRVISYLENHKDVLQYFYVRLVLAKMKFDRNRSEQKLIQNVVATGLLVAEMEYADEQTRPGICALILGIYTLKT